MRDLASVEGCLEAAVDCFGAVDVWVNNAARTEATPFFEIDPEEWDDVLATNLRGAYFGCRVAGRHMQERGSGRIVNLASLAGQWGRSLTGVHYAASKAGIVALTRFAATTLAQQGVTVNAVAPGPIDGPLGGRDATGAGGRVRTADPGASGSAGPRRSQRWSPISHPRRAVSLPARRTTSTAAC